MSGPQMVPPFLFSVEAPEVPNNEGWKIHVVAFDEAHAVRVALAHHTVMMGQPITVISLPFVVGAVE